jgi:hypothetical protein
VDARNTSAQVYSVSTPPSTPRGSRHFGMLVAA